MGSITFDYLLASKKVANLGVNGVAYSSIGTSFLVLAVSLVVVWLKLGFTRALFGEEWDFRWFRRWSRVGVYSALDSFVRNAVYVVFVIRSMNLLEEQDSYWICNTFLWSWLLLPALALADVPNRTSPTQGVSPPTIGRRPPATAPSASPFLSSGRPPTRPGSHSSSTY